MTVRGRIESSFEQFGWWVIRWRWITILSCLMLSFSLISGLQFFRIDNSDEDLLVERVRLLAEERIEKVEGDGFSGYGLDGILSAPDAMVRGDD